VDGRAIERDIQAQALERKAAAGKGTSGNLPPVEIGKTRDQVANLLGTSRNIYEKAKADDQETKK
jgi:hypothetical protein